MASITLNKYLSNVLIPNAMRDTQTHIDYIGFTEDGTWDIDKTKVDLIDIFAITDITKRVATDDKIKIYFEYLNDTGSLKNITEVGVFSSTGNQVPKMTSNTEPYGVASVLGGYSSAYIAFNRTDGNTVIAHNSIPIWFQYEFEDSSAYSYISKYTMFYNSAALLRLPKSWQLQGSNDGTFTDNASGAFILDDVSNEPISHDITKAFFCSSPGSHKYIRLYITEYWDATNIIFPKLQLIENVLIAKTQVTKALADTDTWLAHVDIEPTVDRS